MRLQLKFALLLCVFLAGRSAGMFAQKGFVEGFIVKSNGDTLVGKIKKLSPKKTYATCQIQANGSSEVVGFSPDDLTSYLLYGGKSFASQKVELGKSEKQVFLEFMVDGQADLFRYRDKSGVHYFIRSAAGDITELLNSTEKVSTDNGVYEKRMEEYIFILESVFRDSPEIQEELNLVNLNHKDLIGITEKYHNYVCDEYECIVYTADTKSTNYLGAAIGVGGSRLDFVLRNQMFRFLEEESFEWAPSVKAGLVISSTNVFGFSENLAFSAHLDYQSDRYRTENIDIKMTSLAVPLYLTYTFPAGKLRPVAILGFKNGFFIKKNTKSSFEVPDWLNRFYEDRFRSEFGYGKHVISGLAGLGVEYGQGKTIVFVNMTYEFGSGIFVRQNAGRSDLTSNNHAALLNLGLKRAMN